MLLQLSISGPGHSGEECMLSVGSGQNPAS